MKSMYKGHYGPKDHQAASFQEASKCYGTHKPPYANGWIHNTYSSSG